MIQSCGSPFHPLSCLGRISIFLATREHPGARGRLQWRIKSVMMVSMWNLLRIFHPVQNTPFVEAILWTIVHPSIFSFWLWSKLFHKLHNFFVEHCTASRAQHGMCVRNLTSIKKINQILFSLWVCCLHFLGELVLSNHFSIEMMVFSDLFSIG